MGRTLDERTKYQKKRNNFSFQFYLHLRKALTLLRVKMYDSVSELTEAIESCLACTPRKLSARIFDPLFQILFFPGHSNREARPP